MTDWDKIYDALVLEQEIILHMWKHVSKPDCKECNRIVDMWKELRRKYKI